MSLTPAKTSRKQHHLVIQWQSESLKAIPTPANKTTWNGMSFAMSTSCVLEARHRQPEPFWVLVNILMTRQQGLVVLQQVLSTTTQLPVTIVKSPDIRCGGFHLHDEEYSYVTLQCNGDISRSGSQENIDSTLQNYRQGLNALF